jgi:hypothetical protein
MTIKTLIENAIYLTQKLDIFNLIDDIKSQRKYDLNGDDDDANADDLDEMENLLDDLETAYNLIADKLEEIQNKLTPLADDENE